ncbi:MAG TPA: hypothetical protein VMU34_03915, partial [Mycobacterium sp.]|nr:hypothetical protein [Mycobacterium sp.]
AGWIALAILSILVFFAALIPLVMLAAWRLGFGAPAADGPETSSATRGRPHGRAVARKPSA